MCRRPYHLCMLACWCLLKYILIEKNSMAGDSHPACNTKYNEADDILSHFGILKIFKIDISVTNPPLFTLKPTVPFIWTQNKSFGHFLLRATSQGVPLHSLSPLIEPQIDLVCLFLYVRCAYVSTDKRPSVCPSEFTIYVLTLRACLRLLWGIIVYVCGRFVCLCERQVASSV